MSERTINLRVINDQFRNKAVVAAWLALLALPVPGHAWLAHGFGSGMSRVDVSRYLSDKELAVITESDRQTFAGESGERPRYHLVYCSSPQKLYQMTFRLGDSPSAFVKTLQKYEKRYGAPEGLEQPPGSWNRDNWLNTRVSLIWHLGDSETILLTHDKDGSSAEFQDLSVCQ